MSAATSDSDKAENTAKPSVSANASNNYDSSSNEGFPLKTVLILAFVLAAVIAVEVFVYKLTKRARTKK